MQILDELRHDHDELRAVMSALESGAATPERLARFVTALTTHAHREDELLFVALERYLPADHGPLQVMRSEHEEIEGGLARLGGADPAAPAVRADIARLCALARDHFRKEEEVLFAFAARLLDAPRLAALGVSLRSGAGDPAFERRVL